MSLWRLLRAKRATPTEDEDDRSTAIVLAKLDAAVDRFRVELDRIDEIEQGEEGAGD